MSHSDIEPEDWTCPDIRPMPKEKYVPQDAKSEPELGYYKLSESIIYLGTGVYKRKQGTYYQSPVDHTADVVLVHELAHWATFQPLSPDEKEAFSNLDEAKNTDIIERIAYYTELPYINDKLNELPKDDTLKNALRKKQLCSHLRNSENILQETGGSVD